MSILAVMIWLVLIGVGLYLVNVYLGRYMQKWILKVLNIFVVIAVVIWLLNILGVFTALNFPAPHF